MHDFKELLGDAPSLANALRSLQLSAKEKSDLGTLYSCGSGISVKRDNGRRVRGETIYSCSKVGSKLTKYFNGVGPQDKMMWVGYIQLDGNENEQWVLRPEIRLAIKELGWL